jgi:hypothetical protein
MGKEKKRKCWVCGCTDENCQACIDILGKGCTWEEEDLCSLCGIIGVITLGSPEQKKDIRARAKKWRGMFK